MKKQILYIWVLIITEVLISCKNYQPYNTEANGPFNDSLIVVINDTTQTAYFTKGFSSWNPTLSQVKTIDSIMRESIKDTLIVGRILDFDNYYKQYICFIDFDGDSIVHINGFCRIPEFPSTDSSGVTRFKPRDWKKQIMIVEDGGSCYWQMKINFTKKRFYDYMINGDA
jgi:hypothetical protein